MQDDREGADSRLRGAGKTRYTATFYCRDKAGVSRTGGGYPGRVGPAVGARDMYRWRVGAPREPEGGLEKAEDGRCMQPVLYGFAAFLVFFVV